MKKRYRKQNITGIKRLSIGRTSNNRGYSMSRYIVNLPAEFGLSPASFYFGVNEDQFSAFLAACAYLKEMGELKLTRSKLKQIYYEYDHESLVQRE